MCSLPFLTDLWAIAEALLQDLDRRISTSRTFASRRRLSDFPLVSPVASGTISLSTYCEFANVPPARLCVGVVRRRVGFRRCYSGCQNCSIKRAHWAHPGYAVICALGRRPPGGRRSSADRCESSFRLIFSLDTPRSSRRQALMLSQVVGGGCTGSVGRCKAKQDRHARRRRWWWLLLR
jgi:hypothetical protein